MLGILSIAKQTPTLRRQYRQYLANLPQSKVKFINNYNLFHDVNAIDRLLLFEATRFMRRRNRFKV